MTEKKIIIVGAGIVGVTLAWYLATYSQAEVTLLDRKDAGSGASKDSFAWLNVSYGRPDAYQKLRAQSLIEWRQLDMAMEGRLNIDWHGAISWQISNEETIRFITEHTAKTYKIAQLTKEMLQEKEPLLRHSPEVVAFANKEGALNPQHVIQELLKDIINKGVNYHSNSEVISFRKNSKNDIIGVNTQTAHYEADKVILTAGVDNKSLMKTLGRSLPLTASPSLLLRFQSKKPLEFAKHIISTPEMELRAINAHELIAAEDYIDSQPHNNPSTIADNLLKIIEDYFEGENSLKITDINVGIRPMPMDEMPIVGEFGNIPGLYIISLHAGVTLAPFISHLVMREILFHEIAPELEDYRASRFQ